MQLTRYTDYGLRLLIYLALLPEGKRARIDEISNVYHVSPNHMNKIVHQLGREGIIVTRRGKHGGLSLNKLPRDINIGEVVLMLESNLTVVNCTEPLCRIFPACQLKDIFRQARDAFFAVLKQYTLADVISVRQEELVGLLGLARN